MNTASLTWLPILVRGLILLHSLKLSMDIAYRQDGKSIQSTSQDGERQGISTTKKNILIIVIISDCSSKRLDRQPGGVFEYGKQFYPSYLSWHSWFRQDL
ncbi:hypothetical protein VPH35_103432 [Triticum aestivum]